MTSSEDARLDALLGRVAAAPSVHPDAHEFHEGSLVGGRYRIRTQLGRGGMGVVHRAFDVELSREVALKRVRGELSDRARARVVKEGRAMAQLRHEHVVTIYDVGEHEGAPFLAMELLGGGSLRRWQVGRTPSELLDAYRQAAAGLQAAHCAGLVHRDFKPDNVFVDANARVKVGDLGLASTTTTPYPTADAKSETTAAAGTPAYAAPEQLEGKRVDARADQYAFCIALWEALCGQRPQLVDGQLSIEHHVRRAIPRRLRRVLRRGLAHDPNARHASMLPIVSAMRPHTRTVLPWVGLGVGMLLVGGASMMNAGTPPADRCRVLEARAARIDARLDNPQWSSNVGAEHEDLVRARELALSSLATARLHQWSRELEAVCPAPSSSPPLTCLEDELTRLSDALERLDATPRRLTSSEQTTQRLIPILTACPHTTQARPSFDRDAHASIWIDLQALERRGDDAPSEERLDRAQRLVDRAEPLGDTRLLALTLLFLAREHHARWEYERAERVAERAFHEATRARHDLVAFEALTELVRSSTAARARTRDRWRRMLSEMLSPRMPVRLQAGARVALGDAMHARGEYTAALTHYDAAVKAFGSLREPHEQHRVHSLRARVLPLLGRKSEAIDAARMAHEFFLGDALATAFDRARAQSQFAGALVQGGRASEAQQHAIEAIERLRNAPESPNAPLLKIQLGYVLVTLGHAREAIEVLNEARVLVIERRGTQDRRVASIADMLSWGYSLVGDFDASIRAGEEAIVIREALGDPRLANALSNLASTHYEHGDVETATPLVRRAIEEEARMHPEPTASGAVFRFNLATYLHASRRFEDALPVAIEARELYEANEASAPEQLDLALLEANIRYGLEEYVQTNDQVLAVLADRAFEDMEPINQGSAVMLATYCAWRLYGPEAARKRGEELLPRCPLELQTCQSITNIVRGDYVPAQFQIPR